MADSAVPGHWEGDLLFGSNNSQIATLVERHTRYVMIARVKGKDTETVRRLVAIGGLKPSMLQGPLPLHQNPLGVLLKRRVTDGFQHPALEFNIS